MGVVWESVSLHLWDVPMLSSARPKAAVVLLVCVALTLPVTLRRCGLLGVLAAVTLGALCLLPERLAAVTDDASFGVAHGSPDVSTYGMATLGLGAVALRRGGGRLLTWPLIAFTVLLFTGAAVVWPRGLQTAAGVQQYLLAPLALIGGSMLGRHLVEPAHRHDLRLPRTLALSCGLVLAAQLVAAAIQRAGVPLFEMTPATAALMGDRVNGTLTHPNILGKVVLLLLVVVAPLTRHPDPLTRRLAAAAAVCGLPLLGLTGGRANLLAAVGFILLWVVALPRAASALRYRRWLVAGTVVAIAPFAAGVVGRFREDPFGGSRGALTMQALRALPEHWLLGVGPNRYVTDIGYIDPVSGRGLPVHNIVLLATLELGVVGATLLLSVWALGALRRLRADQPCEVGDAFARALLAASPAVVLVALTGWALLAMSLLPLWFLVLGICLGAAPVTASPWAARRRVTQAQRDPLPS